MNDRRLHRRWWLLVGALWVLATAGDRLWLRLDQALPGWDQADYLNSAVDHGRALGLLAAGGWQGWPALLDLSPKIPPLASLVNGTVMALAGTAPDQAAWALSLWHGVLLVVVACWGRMLAGKGFGLLAALLVALTPALAALRVDFTLDLPLTAATTLALWQLGRWQSPRGGRWPQALLAALAVAAALLIKQSALLVVTLPCLWAAGGALAGRTRRLQVLVALAVVLGLCLPWLHHNWITAIGGTNRAVLESGAAEGDPSPLSPASWFWYPVRWPGQIGPSLLIPALLGGLAAGWRRRDGIGALFRHPVRHLPPGWPWLIGCCLSGWICTTLSPNKDPRYIAPVLPLLLLLLAGGWWELGRALRRRWGSRATRAALGVGLLVAAGTTLAGRAAAIQKQPGAPVEDVIGRLRRAVGTAPTALVVVPTGRELNEHTLTTFGRLDGGRILARRLGKQASDQPLVLRRAEWILLATGDQGSRRPTSRALSRSVRADARFRRVGDWPWNKGRRVELWRRAESPQRFDDDFVRLASGMAEGPTGLARLFERIGPEHLLDPHFLYQQRVSHRALARLRADPRDGEALWSLALLATLRNRPAEAAEWYLRLAEPSMDEGPWPAAYAAVVELAAWNPWQASRILARQAPQTAGNPVTRALSDLSAVLGGRLTRVGALRGSLPEAIRTVERSLETPPPEGGKDQAPKR